MLVLALFLYPLLAAFLSLIIHQKRKIDILVILHALLHFGLGAHGFIRRGSLGQMDDLGLFVFLISSLIYLAVAFYRWGEKEEGTLRRYRIHSLVLMLFIASMDAACMVKDLALIWIFVEATTLSSAILIAYDNSRPSLQAAWKYIFICSVGIALAFVGLLLLVLAQGTNASLHLAKIDPTLLSPFWLKLSFIFIMVGFGTKIGLAPLHLWKPDAYNAAPPALCALLSGALMNTALLPILRVNKIMRAADLGALAQDIYLLMGFISVFVATIYIVKRPNLKRILAYSSIENAGLIMICFGLGGSAIYAGYLHILGHALIKAALFLLAGNIIRLFGKEDCGRQPGLLVKHKVTGWAWLLGLLMLIGFPPSPLFISKFLIFSELMGRGMYPQLILLVLLFASIAYAMLKSSFQMYSQDDSAEKESLSHTAFLSPMALLAIAIVLSIWLPVFD